MSSTERARAVILAAGQGTRMKGGDPKVLEPVLGIPMVHYVLGAVHQAGLRGTVVVVGHEAKRVSESVKEWAKARRDSARIVVQKQQLGTGHAVLQARSAIGSAPEVIVLTGDAPLLRPETLRALIAKHRASGAAATLLGAELSDPAGYGRIVTGPSGNPRRIVEEKDASHDERKIRRVNTGAYCFRRDALFSVLPKVGRQNAKREYYLTDVIGILAAAGEGLAIHVCQDWREALGVNDPEQLAAASAVLRRRVLSRWMREGVRIDDPESTYVEAGVVFEPPLRVRPQTHITGQTRLAKGCDVGPLTILEDARIGEGSRVLASVVRGAQVGRGVWVGPYAHLRPGAVIEDEVKIGNFVEIKKSTVGKGSAIGHLAYVGDATLGEQVNIGAGTITANFDGVRKNPTVIGAGSKVGSNTVFVAPVRVGKRVTTGAGAVVTANMKVPDGATVVGVPARVLSMKGRKKPRK